MRNNISLTDQIDFKNKVEGFIKGFNIKKVEKMKELEYIKTLNLTEEQYQYNYDEISSDIDYINDSLIELKLIRDEIHYDYGTALQHFSTTDFNGYVSFDRFACDYFDQANDPLAIKTSVGTSGKFKIRQKRIQLKTCADCNIPMEVIGTDYVCSKCFKVEQRQQRSMESTRLNYITRVVDRQLQMANPPQSLINIRPYAQEWLKHPEYMLKWLIYKYRIVEEQCKLINNSINQDVYVDVKMSERLVRDVNRCRTVLYNTLQLLNCKHFPENIKQMISSQQINVTKLVNLLYNEHLEYINLSHSDYTMIMYEFDAMLRMAHERSKFENTSELLSLTQDEVLEVIRSYVEYCHKNNVKLSLITTLNRYNVYKYNDKLYDIGKTLLSLSIEKSTEFVEEINDILGFDISLPGLFFDYIGYLEGNGDGIVNESTVIRKIPMRFEYKANSSIILTNTFNINPVEMSANDKTVMIMLIAEFDKFYLANHPSSRKSHANGPHIVTIMWCILHTPRFSKYKRLIDIMPLKDPVAVGHIVGLWSLFRIKMFKLLR